jgi:hypothetical protein
MLENKYINIGALTTTKDKHLELNLLLRVRIVEYTRWNF